MINYTGLRKRPTFEGFVDYLANRQETIRYPDRFAKQIREHPYLTQLDGEGFLEVEEMDRMKAEGEYNEKLARQIADQLIQSAQLTRSAAGPSGARPSMRMPLSRQPSRERSGAYPPTTTPKVTPMSPNASRFLPEYDFGFGIEDYDDSSKKKDEDKREAVVSDARANLESVSSKTIEKAVEQGISKDVREMRGRSRSPGGTRMQSLSPAHRGTTIIASRSSSEPRIKTLQDLQQPGSSSSSSSSQQPGSSSRVRTSSRGPSGSTSTGTVVSNLKKVHFSTEFKLKGGKIEDYYTYFHGLVPNLDLLYEHLNVRKINFEEKESYKELLAKLINHDREIDGVPGQAVVRNIYREVVKKDGTKKLEIVGQTIDIEYKNK
jgi:hypothetical protein